MGLCQYGSTRYDRLINGQFGYIDKIFIVTLWYLPFSLKKNEKSSQLILFFFRFYILKYDRILLD